MTHLKRHRLAVRSLTVAAAALATLGSGLATASAATVATPKGLSASPAGASTPVLAWTRVPFATSYQVQVDNDSSFGSPEFSVTTTNFRATPLKALTAGTNHWRVRAMRSTESSGWASGSFVVAAINVPVPTAPEDGAALPQPTSPPLLQWQGSASAQSYTVEVDGDSDFVGAKSYTTKSTSLVVPDPLSVGDWFWRVTAVKGLGLVSLPSRALSFDILPLDPPVLVSPRDDINAEVEDVVVDWEPVPGARSYDVQIGQDQGFNTIAAQATNVQGTRYSPVITPYNDQMWWRVRAVDAAGQPTPWTTSRFSFKKRPASQPQPVFPLGSPASPSTQTTTTPFYQWNAVSQASYYQLLTASDVNFSSNVDTCTTASTTYAPRSDTDCGFHATGITYWKVRAMDLPYDRPNGLPGVFSDTQAFTWTGWAATGPAATTFSPVTGQRVSIGGNGPGCYADLCPGMPTTPVLSWDPQPGISTYQVYIASDENFTTSVLAPKIITTRNTKVSLELSPIDNAATLPESQAGNAHYWYVRPCSSTGLCGPSPVSQATPLPGTKAFTKSSPAIRNMTASDPAGTELTFSWEDYRVTNDNTVWNGERSNQSASTYRIQVDSEPSFAPPLLDERTVDQTTYTAFDRLYPEGAIYWRVQATSIKNLGEDYMLTWTEGQPFVKKSPEIALTSPGNGASVPGTVPFRWQPQPFAASYTLEVYKNNDRSFSTVNRLFSTTVKTSAYAWNEPIPADANAYVWRVRRTDAEGNPGPWSAAQSFTSLGSAPVLTSPGDGSWQPDAGALLTWTDVPGAASYSVQVSSGGSRVASAITPGNAFATTTLLRTGTYSWQVTAMDSAGKPLGSSLTRTFRVDATAPEVTKVKPGKPKATSTVVVKFSERVKGVSKTTVKLKLKGAKGKKAKVKAKVKLASTGTKATVNPKGKLKRGKTYILMMKPGISDVAGNALAPKKLELKVK